MFTLDHKVTKSRNLCSHSVATLHEAILMFVMADCVGDMIAKTPYKYGECGSFELLALLVSTIAA